MLDNSPWDRNRIRTSVSSTLLAKSLAQRYRVARAIRNVPKPEGGSTITRPEYTTRLLELLMPFVSDSTMSPMLMA